MSLLMTALLALSAQEPPKPQKEHEFLKHFEGEWDFTTKFIMEPGKDPVTGKGKESCRLIAGGLFLVIDTQGEMLGGSFIGHGTMGYDTGKKKYTGSWIDSMASGVYLVEGTVDEKGKVLTETMEGADPATGAPMKMKLVHELKDKDTRVLKFFFPGPDGKDIETGGIEYRRRK